MAVEATPSPHRELGVPADSLVLASGAGALPARALAEHESALGR